MLSPLVTRAGYSSYPEKYDVLAEEVIGHFSAVRIIESASFRGQGGFFHKEGIRNYSSEAWFNNKKEQKKFPKFFHPHLRPPPFACHFWVAVGRAVFSFFGKRKSNVLVHRSHNGVENFHSGLRLHVGMFDQRSFCLFYFFEFTLLKFPAVLHSMRQKKDGSGKNEKPAILFTPKNSLSTPLYTSK